MVIEFSGNDLVRGRADQFGFLFGELSQVVINECRSLLRMPIPVSVRAAFDPRQC
jgi:hypothetical protein